MSKRLDELARRRESLILRSGGQRERLAESVERLNRSLRWAHLARGVVQKIKDNPAALIGATSLIGGPEKFRVAGRLVSMGWSIFRAFRTRRARRRR